MQARFGVTSGLRQRYALSMLAASSRSIRIAPFPAPSPPVHQSTLPPGSRDLAMLPRPRLRNRKPALDQVHRAIPHKGASSWGELERLPRRPRRVTIMCIFCSICTVAVRIRTPLSRKARRQDGCSLLLVAHCHAWWTRSQLIWHPNSILHTPNICQNQYKTDHRSASLASTH